MRIRTLDLFCGGGGSSWGAKTAGADIVCGVDAWDKAIQAYSQNFPGAKAINTTLDEKSRPSLIGDIGPIDLILASPECTHHTCARGSRPRDETSKRTAYYVTKFAKYLKPRWVVIENVVHMRGWHGYDQLLEDMEGLGYYVQPLVLDASDFGVPQNRRRVFILCDREMPPPEHVRQRPGPTSTVQRVLDLSGKWESRPLFRTGIAQPTVDRAKRAIDALGEGVPFLIVYYGSDGSGGWQPLDRPLRTITTLDRFGLVTWENDKPQLRMLQVPELMKAMGFSGGYSLDGIGQRRDRIKLLGNGVCPPVMTAIVNELVAQESPVKLNIGPTRGRKPGRIAAE